ncbi:MAG: hypothetical protein J6A47_01655 [Bacilli bacterium]|nr:hypothetical protein [Bacilli bacterium]MBO6285862.1 hypothetical protein [Bacilli bacterium]
MNPIVEEINHVSNEFFNLDHENKKAHMKLHFVSPQEIFDTNAMTKIPVLSDDFLDWIRAAFDYAPNKYRIDLDIGFDDMGGYDEEQLSEIFKKNILLESRKSMNDKGIQNRLAIKLLSVGLALLVGMILMSCFWKDGGVAEEIIGYVFDIATTVTIWEAMTILLVHNQSIRTYHWNLLKRFSSIRFHSLEIWGICKEKCRNCGIFD